MMHPDTALRPVDPRVGMGVVATRLIRKGTITWVRDGMDQTSSRTALREMHELFRPALHKYTYVMRTGDYVLCWDHGRFMNHSCDPNCIAPGFDFEIAVRDIQTGQELTGDYATYNIEAAFDCLCNAKRCRGRIELDDRLKLADTWDHQVHDAFRSLKAVDQPLWPLVREKSAVEEVLSERIRLPSSRLHFFEPNDQSNR
jgi:hypothetical protein